MSDSCPQSPQIYNGIGFGSGGGSTNIGNGPPCFGGCGNAGFLYISYPGGSDLLIDGSKTKNTTYTFIAGVTYTLILMGGGGAGSFNYSNGAFNGGGSGAIFKTNYTPTSNITANIQIGQGGINGAPGTETVIGGLYSAGGGYNGGLVNVYKSSNRMQSFIQTDITDVVQITYVSAVGGLPAPTTDTEDAQRISSSLILQMNSF